MMMAQQVKFEIENATSDLQMMIIVIPYSLVKDKWEKQPYMLTHYCFIRGILFIMVFRYVWQ